MMRIIWLAALLALLVVPGWAAEWMTVREHGVILHVRPDEDAQARRLTGMIRDELPRVARALELPAIRPIKLYAYASRVEFLRATGIQPHLLGQSWSPSGDILLDVSGDDVQTRTTLAHELTHSLLGQKLGMYESELPRWVNEGIAGHLSSPVSPDETEGTARLMHRDGVLSLKEMDTAFARGGALQDAAYLQARSMVAWLEYQHPGALLKLLEAMAAGTNFDDALQQAAGLTAARWLDDWRHNIPAIVYWLTFLASPVIYSPLALILAWLALRHMLRKREAEVEDEEEDDDEEMLEEEDAADDEARP